MNARIFLYISVLIPLVLGSAAMGQNLQPPEEESQGGTQIAWASEAFALNFMADGITTFEDSGQSIRFELGVFAPGFDPVTATPEQWLSSWIVLQGAEYDFIDQQVIQTTTLFSNATPFAAGTQAYIWGYTTKDLMEGAEWLIVGAPSWTIPSTDSPLPTTFSVSDATMADVLVGSVNQSGHHMQLAAIAAVPEPQTSLLAAIAVAGWGLRRQRRVHPRPMPELPH